ncbi:hypothetical protein AAES_01840 [Amazona aestiva]|uniref:Uncharacterized protein n=1 Tax=Amazona aestiva TaxID=12930 RepID=A0A0Q3X7A0_AMAAE|nr:hypothetical protein AAES_01840 [Amazona aestiva]
MGVMISAQGSTSHCCIQLCDDGSIVPMATGQPVVLWESPLGDQPLPSQLREVPHGLLFLSAFGLEVEHARGHSLTWAVEQGVTATYEKWRVTDICTAENQESQIGLVWRRKA